MLDIVKNTLFPVLRRTRSIPACCIPEKDTVCFFRQRITDLNLARFPHFNRVTRRVVKKAGHGDRNRPASIAAQAKQSTSDGNSKVLVAGASGRVGRLIVKQLAAEGNISC